MSAAIFSFLLTERCNWDCDYCYHPKLKSPKDTTREIIKNHMKYMKGIIDFFDENNALLKLGVIGGEIGLLDKNLLRVFFLSVGKKIDVSTNGKFLENGFHNDPMIKPYINRIFWHICQTPNEEVVEDYESEIPIIRGIVHDDIDKMLEYVTMNNHITFDYLDFDYNVDKIVEVDNEKYYEFYDRIKSMDNVGDYAKEIARQRRNEIPNLKEKCINDNFSIQLDLVNENIVLCNRAFMNGVELNKDNILRRLTTKPKDFFKTFYGCETCTRTYFAKMRDGVEERYKTIKELL